ncbi:MAG: P-II family nitrogen regulator [bacterium]
MELLIIVLNKVDLLNDLLSVLVEAGITRATVLDSEGMGHHLAYEVPIFAGLRKMLGETGAHNKTILALIDDKKSVAELKKLLKEVKIDFNLSGTGIMFTVPVENVVKPENESLKR